MMQIQDSKLKIQDSKTLGYLDTTEQYEKVKFIIDEFELYLGIPALPLPKNRLQIVCSDCLTYMGDKDGEGNTGVSHSLCPACAKKAWDMLESEVRVTTIVKTLDSPVKPGNDGFAYI